ncbi:tyrosine recombinase XerS [Planomicrobium okeanokoites]|uniref:tyrosine recombinase XerS n=1 Tax=Planomicrobium okeanokoites TaxID=244 RepID=UPI002492DB33|nr:tyrosine recombinase XerS [Planomicrobium okeanokoites]
MPAPTRKTIIAEQHIEKAIQDMPFYVIDYIRAKKRASLSPRTLSGYLHDFKRFFDWLRQEGFTTAESNAEVPFTVLESLKKKDIEMFIEMLMEEKILKSEGVYVKRSRDSTTRFIQSLKSLFNYLTQESENDEGECYFYRNVMAKIKSPKNTESAATRSKRISANMLNGNERENFLDFVRHDYIKTLTPRQVAWFERDQLRDIAILSLLLGSGARVDETAGLLITDLDMVHGDIRALRKGNKLDTVSVTETAMIDVKNYLSERERLYKPDPKNLYLFLTKYRGKANPITVETIEKIVKKYTMAFTNGRQMSPHKMRHSFAKGFIDSGGSLIALRDQLGHNSIETTALYTNLSQEEQRAILRRMDSSTVNEEE